MKYIIEFEDEPYMREDGVNYYTCKSARWYKLGDTIINRLTPYNEFDRKAIEDEVWEFADYMCRMSQTEKNRCFGFSYPSEVTTNLTYQEAKSLFEKWMENENEIHVGDEIVGIYSDGEKTPPLVVLKVEGNYYFGIYSKTGDFVQGGLNYEKTGRHFAEVAELLEKMRGEE